MGKTTGISWTARSWNGVIGCSKISPGCSHCYAERLATTKFRHFLRQPVWGPGNPRHITGDQLWKAPLKWARDSLAACRVSGTAFFYKQSSGPVSGKADRLDGIEIKEFPAPRTAAAAA